VLFSNGRMGETPLQRRPALCVFCYWHRNFAWKEVIQMIGIKVQFKSGLTIEVSWPVIAFLPYFAMYTISGAL